MSCCLYVLRSSFACLCGCRRLKKFFSWVWNCICEQSALLLLLLLNWLTNWLAVTTNRQQSPHHRLVPQGGKHHSNATGWSHPQPTLSQRLPSQPAVVMETAVTTREPHTPGVWRTLWTGGGWEWNVQVKLDTIQHAIQRSKEGDVKAIQEKKDKSSRKSRIPETRIKAVNKKKKEHWSFLSSCKGETSDEGRVI